MPTPRRIHRALLSLACATLLLGGLVVTAAPARAVIGIIPTLKCVMYDRAQNQVTATFGYLNANSTAQSVPLGSTNFFSPGSPNQGQPTTFLPGSFPSVFTVTWSLDQSAALSWTLLGTTVTATAQLTSCMGRFAEKPSLVGVPTVGQSVSVDLGMFVPSDQPYDDPAVDWTRDCDTASPTLVGSGTSYAVRAGDAGHRLGATVTWTTIDGAETVGARTACGIEALAGSTPAPSRLAHLTGDDTVGSVLSVDAAWTGTAPLTQSVSWERCSALDCIALGNADSYILVTDDVGYQVRATVTATNAWGSASSVTPSVVVEAAPSPPGPPSTPPPSEVPPVGAPVPAKVDGVVPSTYRLTLVGHVGRRGAIKSLRITNTTAAPMTVGAAMLAGAKRKDFRIVGGTCARRTSLAGHRSCTVRVALKARAKGVRRASLRIPVSGHATLLIKLVGRARG